MSKEIDIRQHMIDNPTRVYRSRFKLDMSRALDTFCNGNCNIDNLSVAIEEIQGKYVSDETYRKANYKPLTFDCQLASVGTFDEDY